MPNPPRQTTVNVTLQSFDPTGKAQFVLLPVGADPLPPPNGPDQTLTFKNDPQGVGHDGINIDFVLIDQTGQGYAFPPNNKKDEAVSSQLGATDLCPAQTTSEVLKAINVSGPNSSVLRVHNPNQDKPGGPKLTGPFSYVLWITKDGGQNYVPLDPGGDNANGSTS